MNNEVLIKRFDEDDFINYLEDLLFFKMIPNDEIDIVKKVVSDDFNNISDFEKEIFLENIIKYNYVDECERCGEVIPWCEMIPALDNGGYCSYCQHMMEKDD